MASPLSAALTLFRENDLRTILRMINSRDTHPFIQFVKYGLCGVGAVACHIVLFTLLLKYVYPQLNDTSMDSWQRAIASFEPTAIVFFIVNVLVYWVNTRWVFQQGRHSPMKEFLLFTLVNMPGALAGSLGQAALIRFLNWHPLLAMIGFVVPNALVNFICRKFFIFKK
jgi:putative flippase GtrA